MSEDEKKAIKIIREDIEVYKEKGAWKENFILVKSLRTLLNLIEKQQEELQQEKEKNKELEEKQDRLAFKTNLYMNDVLSNNIVSKDKIRAILEEYRYTEIGDTEKIIEFYKKIQGLLEEE